MMKRGKMETTKKADTPKPPITKAAGKAQAVPAAAKPARPMAKPVTAGAEKMDKVKEMAAKPMEHHVIGGKVRGQEHPMMNDPSSKHVFHHHIHTHKKAGA